MPASDKFIQKTKKLRERSWKELRALWMRHQDAASHPGEAPVDEINEMLSLKQAVIAAKDQHPVDLEEPIEGLRSYVLKLGFFYCQKAAHNLTSARLSSNCKYGCASLYQAYETAFFACKGVCALLGVIDVTYFGTKTFYIVDTCAERVKGSSSVLGYEHYTRVVNTERISINHKESWAILKRLLRAVLLKM